MYNTKTKNKSFIKMWRELQDSNIENNIFMLELKDESLIDFEIDELKRIEDKDEKNKLLTKVLEECKNNIWFFFREIIRIPNIISSKFNLLDNCPRFVLTPSNIFMIYLYNKQKSFIKLHQSKMGDTTTLVLLYLYDALLNDKCKDEDLVLLINEGNNISNFDFYKYKREFTNTNDDIFRKFQYSLLFDTVKFDINGMPIKVSNDKIAYDKEKLFIDVSSISDTPSQLLKLIKTQQEKERQFYVVTESDADKKYLLTDDEFVNDILFSTLFIRMTDIRDTLPFFEDKIDINKPILLDF